MSDKKITSHDISCTNSFKKFLKGIDMRQNCTVLHMCFLPLKLLVCVNEGEYKAVMKKLDVSNYAPWLSAGARATVHKLDSPDNDFCCIVCIRTQRHNTSIEIAGALVHEAMHIWRWYCEIHGEESPAAEQEAYAMQRISQTLMELYVERLPQAPRI
jgi:hypothetical protein